MPLLAIDNHIVAPPQRRPQLPWPVVAQNPVDAGTQGKNSAVAPLGQHLNASRGEDLPQTSDHRDQQHRIADSAGTDQQQAGHRKGWKSRPRRAWPQPGQQRTDYPVNFF